MQQRFVGAIGVLIGLFFAIDAFWDVTPHDVPAHLAVRRNWRIFGIVTATVGAWFVVAGDRYWPPDFYRWIAGALGRSGKRRDAPRQRERRRTPDAPPKPRRRKPPPGYG